MVCVECLVLEYGASVSLSIAALTGRAILAARLSDVSNSDISQERNLFTVTRVNTPRRTEMYPELLPHW